MNPCTPGGSIKLFLICSCFLLTCSKDAISQNSLGRFKHLDISDGLSNSQVFKIYQDSKGYLWFGTLDGLNRYDGYRFKVYNHVPGNPTSLSNNYVTEILEDSYGNLWIGTNNGLNLYNPYQNNFIVFKNKPSDSASISNNKIYAIAQDRKGNLWLGTQGGGLNVVAADYLTSLAKVTEAKFISFENDSVENASYISNTIWSVYFDKKNTGWIGTRNGLTRMTITGNDIRQVRFKTYKSKKDVKGTLEHSNIYKVVPSDNENAIWCCSFFGGFDRLELNANAYSDREPVFENYFNELKTITGKADGVYSFLSDESGNCWLGYGSNGMIKFRNSLSGGKLIFTDITHDRHDPENPLSIVNDFVYTICRDRSGIVWFGTDAGISSFDLRTESFNVRSYQAAIRRISYPSVTGIIKTHNNVLWIGTTQEGVFGINSANDKLIRLSNEEKNELWLSNNSVNHFYEDKKGNLWIGTHYGLNCFSFSESKLSPTSSKMYYNLDGDSTSIIGNHVTYIYEDKGGRIWVCTSRGLSVFNPETEKFRSYQKQEHSPYSMSSNFVFCVWEDNRGNIWAGTDDGLNKINSATGQVAHLFSNADDLTGLNNDRIISLNQLNDSILLIGTSGGGLNIMNLNTGVITHFTNRHGLPNNVVNEIIIDRARRIWLSTYKGISLFDYEKLSCTNYSEDDGLLSNQSNIHTLWADRNNEIFVGNLRGFNSFFPDQIIKNNYVPPIVITDIRIADQSVFDLPDTVLLSTILRENKIILEYNQNFFSFEFSALNFINPSKNQYRYTLQGVDPGWINAGTRHFASYTNISPGNYTFYVTGSNNAGVWNDNGIKFNVVIKPPFTGTWYFRGALTLLAFILVTLIYRQRIRNIETRKKQELAEHKTQMTEMFLANMSHEIRTPMNAIVGITNLMIDNNPKSDQIKYLNMMRQSSDNLLVIINDILDISKIEAGKLELEEIPFHIKDVAENTFDMLRIKAENKGLKFEMQIDASVPDYIIGDRVRLNQILINLIGNAIKFTEKGFVKLEIKKTFIASGQVNEGLAMISFIVSDSGIGIAPEHAERIFESFSQASTDTTRKYGGTGLGLAISKQLSLLMGGNISVQSRAGEGSVFTVELPCIEAKMPSSKEVKAIDVTEEIQPGNVSILLVEDNEFNRVIACDTLHRLIPGCSIDTAMNGKEALEKIISGSYDVVLMDVQMPVMDGYEATRQIRSLKSRKKNIPVIAMTAGVLSAEVQRCYEAGMDDFIPKPFDSADLLKKIYKAMDRF